MKRGFKNKEFFFTLKIKKIIEIDQKAKCFKINN